MIKWQDAIREARLLLGTPYSELDCINLIKKVIRKAPGGVPSYTTAGTNALWKSYDMSGKYRDLTWRQEGLDGACAGMIAFKADGSDYHHAGIVTGDGTVIHSSSTQGGRGVVETPLTAKEGWTHLAVHRYIEIEADEERGETPMEENALFRALVVTASGALNMREAPSTGAMVVEKIPKGAEVEVLEKTDEEWWRVRYKGETGYAAEEYLSRIEESSTITISRSTAQALYDALGEALTAAGGSID